jgi:SAM-dependent methyltransferase
VTPQALRPGISSSVLPLSPKSSGYYEHGREDLLAALPRPLGRVLDLGCGAGGVGYRLRPEGPKALVGVEIEADQASRAGAVYDEVLVCDIDEALDRLNSRRFDTVLCYDVLEHLFDPAAVLRRARALASDGAHMHISIPNARNILLLRDLLIRGTFGYVPEGHRDSTHIRWFTRRDIVALVTECGWVVESVGTDKFKANRRRPSRLSGGRADEFLAVQWHVLCRAAAPPPTSPNGAQPARNAA